MKDETLRATNLLFFFLFNFFHDEMEREFDDVSLLQSISSCCNKFVNSVDRVTSFAWMSTLFFCVAIRLMN